jgi:phosphatidylserine decarboxylase
VPVPVTKVAPEGVPFIVAFAVVAVLGSWVASSWVFSLPLWVLTAWCVWFFRDPERAVPPSADAPDVLVAPADGRVICIEEEDAPLSGVPARKVSIFMNVFNVHVNRSPAAGEVVSLAYCKGRFLNAAVDKASHENERMEILLRTGSGEFISFVQIAGLVARRIVCRLGRGQQLERGERIGLIRFGSRVDLYVPRSAAIHVALGDLTVAGETVVARLSPSSHGGTSHA